MRCRPAQPTCTASRPGRRSSVLCGECRRVGACHFMAALPFFAGRDLVEELIFVFYMAALAQCWNLLAGYTGLVSVGQQAFVGLGGYLLFALTIMAGIDPLAAIVLSGVIAAAFALPTALIVFRLRARLLRDRDLGRGRGLSAGLCAIQAAGRRHRNLAWSGHHQFGLRHRLDQVPVRREDACGARHHFLFGWRWRWRSAPFYWSISFSAPVAALRSARSVKFRGCRGKRRRPQLADQAHHLRHRGRGYGHDRRAHSICRRRAYRQTRHSRCSIGPRMSSLSS